MVAGVSPTAATVAVATTAALITRRGSPRPSPPAPGAGALAGTALSRTAPGSPGRPAQARDHLRVRVALPHPLGAAEPGDRRPICLPATICRRARKIGQKTS